MIHFGRGVFGSDFGTTAFVIAKKHTPDYISVYRRLFKKQGAVDSVEQKEKWFFEGMGYHTAKQENFSKIPGMPVAYWVSSKFLSLYGNKCFLDFFSFKRGIGTGDNDLYLRYWYEVAQGQHSGPKWYAYNKGGEFRKWYGNRNYVVNWENEGYAIRHNFKNGRLASRPQNTQYNYVENISYSSLTASTLSFRHYIGFINDQAGNYFVPNSKFPTMVALALLNSVVAPYCISLKNSTLNTTAEDFKAIPCKKLDNDVNDNIIFIAQNNEELSKKDWDSFETSWDFEGHPLI